MKTCIEEAIRGAYRPQDLDQIARRLWAANGCGQIDDIDALSLATLLETRRVALVKPRVELSVNRLRKPVQRSPDRERSISRRRGLAASGAVPSKLATAFTVGELAVLSVIARECQRRGTCTLFMDQLAAMAGVSRTTARNAIKEAEGRGLLIRNERRLSRDRSDSNVISIISKEWSLWLKLGLGGGRKNTPTTNTNIYNRPKPLKQAHATQAQHVVQAPNSDHNMGRRGQANSM